MKTTQRAYDLAYGCFLVCGLTVLSMRVVRSSYTDAEWAGGAAGLLFIFLPAILASCIATLVGIVDKRSAHHGVPHWVWLNYVPERRTCRLRCRSCRNVWNVVSGSEKAISSACCADRRQVNGQSYDGVRPQQLSRGVKRPPVKSLR